MPAFRFAALVLFVLCLPDAAQASVQRCVTPDGRTVYTDRPCSAFDAVPARGTTPAGGNAGASGTMTEAGAVGGFAVRGCARSPDALLRGVRDALHARDVNRLAGWYHWSGTGSAAANAVMARLERVASTPGGAVELLGVAGTPVAPSASAAPVAPAGSGGTPPPVALRVAAAGVGAPATTFSLHRNAGCWWIRF